MIRISKVYIYLEDAKDIVILETSHPTAGKEAYTYIKEQLSIDNIGIIGARDIQTLRRIHRELKLTHVTRDVNKFLKVVSGIKK